MAAALMIIGAAAFVSCHGRPDEPIVEPDDPKLNVPEGVVRK